MDKQMNLSGLMDGLSQARTKKKEFLEQMDQLIPWEKWVEEIRPCYYKGERGNTPYGIELMLRLYVLQNLYTLMAIMRCCLKPFSEYFPISALLERLLYIIIPFS